MTGTRFSFFPASPAVPSAMSAPRRPAGPSRLTADARRALALHAGGDLDGRAAADAQALADGCPDCRGHLHAVRGGLAALADCDAGPSDGGLWPGVRAALPAVTPAAPPAKARWYAPALAVTAAAILVGAFAFGPGGNATPFAGDARAPRAVGGDELPSGVRVLRDADGNLIVPRGLPLRRSPPARPFAPGTR